MDDVLIVVIGNEFITKRIVNRSIVKIKPHAGHFKIHMEKHSKYYFPVLNSIEFI